MRSNECVNSAKVCSPDVSHRELEHGGVPACTGECADAENETIDNEGPRERRTGGNRDRSERLRT